MSKTYKYEKTSKTMKGEWNYTIKIEAKDLTTLAQLSEHHEDFILGVLKNYRPIIKQLKEHGALNKDCECSDNTSLSWHELWDMNKEKDRRIRKLEHELHSLNGLNCTDQPVDEKDFDKYNMFHLDLSKVLKEQ